MYIIQSSVYLYFGYRIFRVGTVLNKKCMESDLNSQALISAIATETTTPKDNKNISDTSSSMLVCSLAYYWMQRQMKGLDCHIQNLLQIWIWLFEELPQFELWLFIKTTFVWKKRTPRPRWQETSGKFQTAVFQKNSTLEETTITTNLVSSSGIH